MEYAPQVAERLPEELQPYEADIFRFAEIIGKEWPNWSYHNFYDHARETVADFLAQVAYARHNGVVISTNTVVAGVLSALEHDVLNQDGKPYFYDQMEERSAAIGDGVAKLIGFSKDIIDQKHAATLATAPGSKCTSLLDRMIRRADIANLAWDYDNFKQKTISYWREVQLQCAEQKTFSEWVRSDIVQEKLLVLLDEDLSLGPFDKGVNSPSNFQDDVLVNFRDLDAELESPEFVEPELYGP